MGQKKWEVSIKELERKRFETGGFAGKINLLGYGHVCLCHAMSGILRMGRRNREAAGEGPTGDIMSKQRLGLKDHFHIVLGWPLALYRDTLRYISLVFGRKHLTVKF